ncbi:hypothetical protein MMC27_004109 [Xylographa pallens]|nr:hypothetical protein [Xylographa pallens]
MAGRSYFPGRDPSRPPPPIPPRPNVTTRKPSPLYAAQTSEPNYGQDVADRFGALTLQRGDTSRNNGGALMVPGASSMIPDQRLPVELNRASTSSPWSDSPAPGKERRRVSERPEAPRIRKILSLDGGGVRGLSIIMILSHLMRNLNRKRGVEVQPWEEFDMIGGTSTGGIIAIMLGRLHMSLEECEAAYKQLSSRIFSTRNRHSADPRRIYDFLQANGKFDPQPLEESIRNILRQHDLADNELLQDNNAEACRVFVCATRALNSAPAVLRSYSTFKNDPYYDICEIWEAARATSAASTFFPPIQLGRHDEVFVDGKLTLRLSNLKREYRPRRYIRVPHAMRGLRTKGTIGAFRRNNPIRVANIESAEIWPDEDCVFISIGTGTAPGRSLLGNLADLADKLTDIVTDTELTNREFRSENRDLIRDSKFFRFNVDDGSMAKIGLDEYQEAAKIATNTNNYLDDPRVEENANLCVERLRLGGQRLGWATREGKVLSRT